METIGARILEARKQKGLSQRELSEALGITVQAISQWENNRTEPTGRLSRIAEILDVPEHWLQEGDTPDLDIKRLEQPIMSQQVPLIEFDKVPLFVQGIRAPSDLATRRCIYSSVKAAGQLFAIRARQLDESIKIGDILIFDSGVRYENGDVICAMIMETPYVQLMGGASAFPEGHVSVGIGRMQTQTGSGASPTLGPQLIIGGEITAKHVMIVGTMVEQRTFREPAFT